MLENFEGRHRNLLETFETRAAEMEDALEPHAALNKTRRCLIGAYFLNEYSFEASALFNPSIVRHHDQTGAPENGCRFILSLRAVGEGHISSLTFRSGTIAADGSVFVDPTARLASVPKIQSRTSRHNGDDIEVIFRPDEELSERVIFPVTDAQAHGIEDARFVEFNDDGQKTFYATYTAYSGWAIRSELLATTDFQSFKMTPLSGSAARNKGMALFPRKIDGRYAMIARQDNENLYLIYSDDLYTWDGGRSILQPEYPWEFVQIGNCGSPVELDDCWLLLIHGLVRSGNIRSELFSSIRRIPPRFSRVRASLWFAPSPRNARVTYPMLSTPAAPYVIATRSSCHMPCPTPSPISRRYR